METIETKIGFSNSAEWKMAFYRNNIRRIACKIVLIQLISTEFYVLLTMLLCISLDNDQLDAHLLHFTIRLL